MAGFVYHGTQFPSSYQGSFFFADYAGHTIRRLTFDANGNVTGVFNFEPADGSADGPYGDIVYLTEGPEGALYYVDILGLERDNARRRRQDPPHQLCEFQPAAGGCGLRDADGRASPRSPSISRAPAHPIPKERRSAIHGILATDTTSTAANPPTPITMPVSIRPGSRSRTA